MNEPLWTLVVFESLRMVAISVYVPGLSMERIFEKSAMPPATAVVMVVPTE